MRAFGGGAFLMPVVFPKNLSPGSYLEVSAVPRSSGSNLPGFVLKGERP